MIQQMKYAVSFIVYRNDGKEFLVTKRPKEDKELGDIWGLPATSFDITKETPEQALLRGGMEKLGCEIKPIRRIPISMIQERDGYDLLLIEYECVVVSGEPDIKKTSTSGTKYVEQMWVTNPEILQEGARKGSICIQLFLFDRNLWKKEEFVTKLS